MLSSTNTLSLKKDKTFVFTNVYFGIHRKRGTYEIKHDSILVLHYNNPQKAYYKDGIILKDRFSPYSLNERGMLLMRNMSTNTNDDSFYAAKFDRSEVEFYITKNDLAR